VAVTLAKASMVSITPSIQGIEILTTGFFRHLWGITTHPRSGMLPLAVGYGKCNVALAYGSEHYKNKKEIKSVHR